MIRRIALLAALAGCRDPTQITAVFTTEEPCDKVTATNVTVGAPAAIDSRTPTTSSTFCGAGGDLGTLVLVPSGDRSSEVAFRIALGIGADPEACATPHDGMPCIVATRALHFEPHTPLKVLVPLRASCAGVACSSGTTCVAGRCAPFTIGDAERCTAGGCDESALQPALQSTPDAGADADATVASDALAPDAFTSDVGTPVGDYALWTYVTGPGTGTLTVTTPAGLTCAAVQNPIPACEWNIPAGATVVVSALTSGILASWGGACGGQPATDTCTFVMNGPTSVSANVLNE